jgi:Zn-dependent protease
MGIQDRRYNQSGSGDFGEGGGFRRAFRRIFGEGDNFFSWAVPFFTVGGISVRIHIFYLIYIASQLIWPLNPGTTGLIFTASLLGSMFVFVLLHEFGHCLACRRVGGEAETIIMWPLGGLAMCVPPRNWKAAFITTVCGPLVNVVLAMLFAGVLFGLGIGWRSLAFNPIHPWQAATLDPWFQSTQSVAIAKQLLYSGYQANVFLVLFNVLLPMYPMDGGRLLQEILWRTHGFKSATRIATTVGLVFAVLLGGFAAMNGLNLLFSICFFCGLTCYREKQMLSMMEDDATWGYDTDKGFGGFGKADGGRTAAENKAYKAALKHQEKDRKIQAEVDRILAKIRERGMQSLSRGEKAVLKEATERGLGKG